MDVHSVIVGRTAATPLRELAVRESAGIEVALLWDPTGDRVLLRVHDRREGGSFEHAVAASDALEAFYHPFAHAAPGDLEAAA